MIVTALKFFYRRDLSILSIYVGLKMNIRFILSGPTPYYTILLIRLFQIHLPGSLSLGSSDILCHLHCSGFSAVSSSLHKSPQALLVYFYPQSFSPKSPAEKKLLEHNLITSCPYSFSHCQHVVLEFLVCVYNTCLNSWLVSAFRAPRIRFRLFFSKTRFLM